MKTGLDESMNTDGCNGDAQPLVSIVIPNYNGEKCIRQCLLTVFRTVYPRIEIILFDDNSSDESAEIIRREFGCYSNLRLIVNKVNIGPAGARNTALKYAKGEYVAFLDNDDEVDPFWITEAIKIFRNNKGVGGVFGKLMELTDKRKLRAAGIYLIPYTVWGFPVGLGEEDLGQYDNRIRYTCAVSTGLIVRKEIMIRIGGFDERLRCLTEDLDFSWRVWLAGYKILFSPNSIVFHLTRSPKEREIVQGVTVININFHLTKNSIRSMLKNYEKNNLNKYVTWFLVLTCLRMLMALKENNPTVIIGIVRGILWNLINMRDTLQHRRFVQSRVRRVSDACLFEKIMIKGSPLDTYRNLRQKLNGNDDREL